MFLSYNNDTPPAQAGNFLYWNSSLITRFIVEGLKSTASLAASYGMQQLKGTLSRLAGVISGKKRDRARDLLLGGKDGLNQEVENYMESKVDIPFEMTDSINKILMLSHK